MLLPPTLLMPQSSLLLLSGAFNTLFGGQLYREAAPGELTRHLPSVHHVSSLKMAGRSRGVLLGLLGLIQIAGAYSPPSPLRSAVCGAMMAGDIYCIGVMIWAKRIGFSPATAMDRNFHSSFTLLWCLFEASCMGYLILSS